MKFLYISNTTRINRPYLDPSVRYRCYNYTQELNSLGYIADVISFDQFEIKMCLNYDIFVFHRPPFDNKLLESIEILVRYNKIYVADYDDLIFNKKYALISPLYKQGRASKEKCLDIFHRNDKSLKLFKNVQVSTLSLAQKVLESNSNANVNVSYNALSSQLINEIELNPIKYGKVKSSKKIISYLSGTASHNKDFKEIENTLIELTNKYYSKTSLIIVGPLKFNLNEFKNIKHKKYVEYNELFKFISKTHINIAPLELNDFTNCKSGLKFFESAILNIPSVVSPITDMLRFEESEGVSFASSQKDWYDGLERLILDDEFYEKQSYNAFNYTLENCVMSKEIKNFIKFIEDCK